MSFNVWDFWKDEPDPLENQQEPDMPLGEELLSTYTTGGSQLFNFCKSYQFAPDVRHQPHDEMCSFIDGATPEHDADSGDPERDQREYYLLLVPRGTYKTSVVKGAAAKFLTGHPNGRVLFDCHRHEVAHERLESMEMIFEQSPRFREDFGAWEIGAPKWTKDGIILPQRTRWSLNESSIDTSGVNRAKTGGHYDWIICDDLHSKQNYQTEVMRAKVKDHIDQMHPLLEPWGKLLIIGTRWHYSDAYGQIIKEDAARKKRGEKPLYHKLIRSCFDGPEGLYFPAVLNLRALNSLREHMTTRMFAVHYLNQPREDKEKLFPRNLHHPFNGTFYVDQGIPLVEMANGVRLPLFVTMAWDTAGADNTSEDSDYHGFTVNGQDAVGRHFVLAADAVKAQAEDVYERAIQLILFYQPRVVTIENKSGGDLWLMGLQERLHKRGIYIEVRLFKTGNQETKYSRIDNTLQPLFKRGLIHIHKDLTDFMDQLYEFPDVTNDDLVDSYVQHHDAVQGSSKPADPRALAPLVELEQDDEEWFGSNDDPEQVLTRGTSTGGSPNPASGPKKMYHSEQWGDVDRLVGGV